MSTRKTHHTSDSSDDEVPLKKLKRTSSTTPDSTDSDSSMVMPVTRKDACSNSYKGLYGYSMEKCEFCNSIFHNRYDQFVHNSEHLVIILERHPLHKCPYCSAQFASLQQLHHHNITKHITNEPHIIANIVEQNLLQEWDELSRLKNYDISSDEGPLSPVFQIENKSRNANRVNKNDVVNNTDKTSAVHCGDSLTESIKTNHDKNINKIDLDFIRNDVLQSIVEKMPVIRCVDNVMELVNVRNNKNVGKSDKNNIIYDKKTINNDIILESIIEKKPVVRCVDNITELINVRNVVKNEYDKRTINNDYILESIVEKTPVIRCVDNLSELINVRNCKNVDKDDKINIKYDKRTIDNDNILQSIVEKMPVIRCDDSVTELIKVSNDKNMKNNKNISLGIVEKSLQGEDKSTKKYEEIQLFESNTSNLRSRIIFENDSDDDNLFTDDKNNLQDLVSSMNGINKNHEFALVKTVGNSVVKPKMNKIMLGSRTDKSIESIHYENLIKPGLYFCKRCKISFPNRYETYIHEKCHIKIRQPRPPVCPHCDRYIAGNYKTLDRHIERKHGDCTRKKRNSSTCKICGLRYYKYTRHSQLYHYVHKCNTCGMRFQLESDKIDHEQRSVIEGSCADLNVGDAGWVTSKVDNHGWKYMESAIERPKVEGTTEDYREYKFIKVCDVCSMFVKTNHNIKYTQVGELSKVGEQQQCERCGKMYFEVKLMKALRKGLKRKEYKRADSGSKSNEQRLKNIHHRLKRIKKFSRLYVVLFYFRCSDRYYQF